MIKLYQINDFQELYEEIKKTSLPLPVAYKFNKIFNKLQEELEFLQVNFQKIIKEYGEKDSEGNLVFTENNLGVKIKEGKEEECNLKLVELQNMEVELPNIRFSLEELSNLSLSIEKTHSLLPFIQED